MGAPGTKMDPRFRGDDAVLALCLSTRERLRKKNGDAPSVPTGDPQGWDDAALEKRGARNTAAFRIPRFVNERNLRGLAFALGRRVLDEYRGHAGVGVHGNGDRDGRTGGLTSPMVEVPSGVRKRK